MRTVDLFLRTYPIDYKWLPFLVRSMVKHVREFRRLVVVTAEWTPEPPLLMPGSEGSAALLGAGVVNEVQLATCPKYVDDYVGQQIAKLSAAEHTDADEVCYLDSDLVFKRPFHPGSMRGGQNALLRIETRHWTDVGQAVCWRKPTAKLLGVDPPFETMARHPFQYPVAFVKRVLDFVGGPQVLAKLDRHSLSEFNLLGNFALLHEPEKFWITSPTAPDAEPDHVRQFWSWGGITEEVQDELRELGVWEG